MKVAILGAGFTGLTAALRLIQKGHQVTILEKESAPGGLAGGFKEKDWEWTLEKSYHHWFTNDSYALDLAKEVGQSVLISHPKTDTYIKGGISTLDSPLSLLLFSYLPIIDRLRLGAGLFYLRTLKDVRKLEGKLALPWIKRWMGKAGARLIWEPLFQGKFGQFKDEIALSWFWARIKKRTSSLAYPEGGFQNFADRLAQKIESLGGKVIYDSQVTSLKSSGHSVDLTFSTKGQRLKFDTVISTLPTSVFIKIASQLPQDYTRKISSIPHLHALNLVLLLKEPFLKKSYWLNVTDTSFPFLVLAEHTNFMDRKYYGENHILYVGNYLPEHHPFLKMSANELLQVFDPYLKRLNSTYHLSLITYNSFTSPYAQPIVTPGYPNRIPKMQTPLKGVYMANLDMVYPWDRGTNYAIELGEKVASLVDKQI